MKIKATKLFLTSFIFVLSARAEDGLESKLQTAFVYQFTNYIEWPKDTANKDIFYIGVCGHSSLIKPLEELAKSKTVKGVKIIVRTQTLADPIWENHVLIIDEKDSVEAIVKKVRGYPVLTISKGEGLSQKGVVVNFFVDDGKLRFEINRKMAEAQKLSISSQLLKLARIIE